MPISPDTRLSLVHDLDSACEFMRWLGQRRDGPLAFDSETTGLNPLVDRVRTVQFGDKMAGWAIPFEQPHSWGGLVAQVFQQWEGQFVAHNSNYDVAMLASEGIQLPRERIHDTRLLAAVLEPEYSNALKAQASRHVDRKAAGASKQLEEVMHKHGWTWATIPIIKDPTHPAYIYHVYGCVPLDTLILTRRGFVGWDELRPGDETIGMRPDGFLDWTGIVGKRTYSNAPMWKFGNQRWNTLATANHRWVHETVGGTRHIGPVPTDKPSSHRLVLSGHHVGGDSSVTPGQAAVMGWLMSDGHIHWQRPRSSPDPHISQSDKKYADEIRNLLVSEDAYVSERHRPGSGWAGSDGCIVFTVQATYVSRLWDTAGVHDLPLTAVVANFTQEAREAWLDSFIKADGNNSQKGRPGAVITKGDPKKIDAVALAAALSGHVVTNRHSPTPTYERVSLGSRRITHQKVAPQPGGEEDVWCPITGSGSWMARDRSGNIFLTGNSLDTVLTAHLYDVHMPTVQASCLPAYDLERATAWLTRDMEARGVTCDRAFTQTKYDQFTSYIDQSAAWIEREWGCPPGSTAQVVETLLAAGVQLAKQTPGGSWSLDREVLEELKHPLAQAVLKRRRTEKAASAFLAPFLRYSERDGLLHPNINSVGGSSKSTGESGGMSGVRTGRMSMSEPNLQALPRVGDGNPAADVVRNCIVPRPGRTFVMVDYSQVELRLLAHFADDDGLRAAFGGKLDAFTTLARQIYNEPGLQRKDPRRSITKSAVYAKSYGAGVNKFALTAGIDSVSAQQFMATFDRSFPGIKRKMTELVQTARTVGYTASPLTGKPIRAEQGYEYKLMNTLVQSTAAEVLKSALLRADAAGLGEYLVLAIHDELVADCPTELVPEVTKLLVDAMQDTTSFSVPLLVDASTGVRFGEKVAT